MSLLILYIIVFSHFVLLCSVSHFYTWCSLHLQGPFSSLDLPFFSHLFFPLTTLSFFRVHFIASCSVDFHLQIYLITLYLSITTNHKSLLFHFQSQNLEVRIILIILLLYLFYAPPFILPRFQFSQPWLVTINFNNYLKYKRNLHIK